MAEQLRILVVDDDNSVRATTIEYLHSFGYKDLLIATNGKEAVMIAQSQPVDLIISDWEMPEMNGLELLRVLRSDEKTRKIPFIVVTSPGSQERMKIMEAGNQHADAYILKPFRGHLLQDKIGEVMARKNSEKRGAILVVDDDESVRGTVAEIVSREGFSPIYEAANGEEGFTLLQEHASEITIVLSDWEMPELSGIDFLKRIRDDQVLKHMPFIMVTSQVSIENMKLQQAIDSDVDHYLMKPFAPSDLVAKIRHVLQRASAQAETNRKMDLANQALNTRQLERSAQLFKVILKNMPQSVDAHLGLAQVYLHETPRQHFDEALQHLREAIQIDPKRDEAYIALALAYESALSLENANLQLREGLKSCPESAKLHFQLGRLLLRRGKHKEASESLKKALEIRADLKEAKELLETAEAELAKRQPPR